MLKHVIVSEIVILSILVILLCLLLVMPTSLLMPMESVTFAILALMISFLAFGVLYWKEKTIDEREELHKFRASRASFMVGSSLLILGICYQTWQHDIDPWLVITLISMLTVKLFSRIQSRLHN